MKVFALLVLVIFMMLGIASKFDMHIDEIENNRYKQD